MKKALLFGTGSAMSQYKKYINQNYISIIGYLDNNNDMVGKIIDGQKVYSVLELYKLKFDYIIIMSSYSFEIKEQLLNIGIEKSKIITLGFLEFDYISKYNQMLNKYVDFNKVDNNNIFNKNIEKNYYVVSSVNDIEDKLNMDDYILNSPDYVRLSTIKLISEIIKEKSIEGDIAELGVYKGDLTRFMSKQFVERDYYLLDTFEGFDSRDVTLEVKNNYSNSKENHLYIDNFYDVFQEYLIDKRFKFIKGYFPDSAKNINDKKFAFVSIDVDLYNPTYEGLCFFYERLSKGGFLIVHDYGYDKYRGVREAVSKFSREYNINYVPISDYFRSVVFVKN